MQNCIFIYTLVLYQVDKVMILTKSLVHNAKKNQTKVTILCCFFNHIDECHRAML